MSDYI